METSGNYLQVRAAARGDSVEVSFEADKIGPEADYNLALVQAEEKKSLSIPRVSAALYA
jgi:hypothetical protein